MTDMHLPRALPCEKGVDARGISDFIEAVNAAGLELHSFMLYRAGAVVAEAYWSPYRADRPHVQHSATKSWAATAVGLLVDDGCLSLDDKVVGFFPDDCPSVISDNLAAMTVRDLLTMRTGHQRGISGGAWRGLQDSWVRAFLAEPVADRPGEHFIYSSGSSFMLSAIATRVSGKTLHELCTERLFRPMGMGRVDWDMAPDGYNTGGNGLTCTTEDSLKFGVLHLNRGQWLGQQLLSGQWVDEATRNHVEHVWMGEFDGKRFLGREEGGQGAVAKRDGYGYQWWMTRHGGYYASGVFGQQCIVLPDQQTVIAFTCGLPLGERRLHTLMWEHLFPALDIPVRLPGLAEQQLQALIKRLRLPELAGACESPARSLLQGRFAIEPNEDQVTHVSFDFSAGACEFTLSDHRGTHRIAVGLAQGIESQTSMTGNYLHHQYQPDLTPVVAQGRWTAEHEFTMNWRFVETAFSDRVVCRVEQGQLFLDRSVNANAGPLWRPTLTGKSVQ